MIMKLLFVLTIGAIRFCHYIFQDNLRLVGSWSDRHVLLFHRAILLTKKLRDGSLQTKACLNVRVDFCNDKYINVLNILSAFYFCVVSMVSRCGDHV